MLTLNSSNKVTFSVNVHGTSATPTVRCIVGEFPGLQFPATKLADGKYEALVDLPKTLREGAYDFKVEVLLNGRLFTPISTKIDVVGGYENKVSDDRVAELEPPVEQPLETVLKHAATKTEEALPPTAPVMPAPKVESLLKKVDETAPAKKPKVSRVEPKLTPKPAMSALESVAKAPVQKRKVATPSPAPAPMKFSMKDIANEAVESDTHTKAEHAPTVVVEQVTSIPISLVRGDIIYK